MEKTLSRMAEWNVDGDTPGWIVRIESGYGGLEGPVNLVPAPWWSHLDESASQNELAQLVADTIQWERRAIDDKRLNDQAQAWLAGEDL